MNPVACTTPSGKKKFPWVSKAKDGTQQAYCKLCHKVLQPRKGKATLKGHADSKDHTQQVSWISSASTSMFQSFKKVSSASEKLKIAELQLAVENHMPLSSCCCRLLE